MPFEKMEINMIDKNEILNYKIPIFPDSQFAFTFHDSLLMFMFVLSGINKQRIFEGYEQEKYIKIFRTIIKRFSLFEEFHNLNNNELIMGIRKFIITNYLFDLDVNNLPDEFMILNYTKIKHKDSMFYKNAHYHKMIKEYCLFINIIDNEQREKIVKEMDIKKRNYLKKNIKNDEKYMLYGDLLFFNINRLYVVKTNLFSIKKRFQFLYHMIINDGVFSNLVKNNNKEIYMNSLLPKELHGRYNSWVYHFASLYDILLIHLPNVVEYKKTLLSMSQRKQISSHQVTGLNKKTIKKINKDIKKMIDKHGITNNQMVGLIRNYHL